MPKIFPGSYLYLGDFEVPLVLSIFGLCYPTHTIDPSCDYLREHWLYLGDLKLPYLCITGGTCRSYSVSVLARYGSESTTLYALRPRGTIICYTPPLIVYGILTPLLGETYLLHSGSHISPPWFSCILAIDFLRSMLFVHYLAFGIVIT